MSIFLSDFRDEAHKSQVWKKLHVYWILIKWQIWKTCLDSIEYFQPKAMRVEQRFPAMGRWDFAVNVDWGGGVGTYNNKLFKCLSSDAAAFHSRI